MQFPARRALTALLGAAALGAALLGALPSSASAATGPTWTLTDQFAPVLGTGPGPHYACIDLHGNGSAFPLHLSGSWSTPLTYGFTTPSTLPAGFGTTGPNTIAPARVVDPADTTAFLDPSDPALVDTATGADERMPSLGLIPPPGWNFRVTGGTFDVTVFVTDGTTTVTEAIPYRVTGQNYCQPSHQFPLPNQVVRASCNPVPVPSPTQATYPSGRISTAAGAVTEPRTGSSHGPPYSASISWIRSAQGVMSRTRD